MRDSQCKFSFPFRTVTVDTVSLSMNLQKKLTTDPRSEEKAIYSPLILLPFTSFSGHHPHFL